MKRVGIVGSREYTNRRKIKEFVFYGCKQKNNNNFFLQLDLQDKFKNY